MKYRNDFVTNSSSLISLWKDFSIKLHDNKDFKIKYKKKITIYSGFPVDLKMKEVDLQEFIENGGELARLRFVYKTTVLPNVLEKLILTDIFIDFLKEQDIILKVIQSKTSGKLYLQANFKGENPISFDLNSPNVEFDSDYWFRNYSELCRNKGIKTSESWDTLNPRDCAIFEDVDFTEAFPFESFFLDKEPLLPDTYYYSSEQIAYSAFMEDCDYNWLNSFIYSYAKFLLMFAKNYNKIQPPFHLWLANNYGFSGAITIKAEGLCSEKDFLGEVSGKTYMGQMTKKREYVKKVEFSAK